MAHEPTISEAAYNEVHFGEAYAAPQYEVRYWGSHPALNNDDCWTSKEFSSMGAAITFFNDPPNLPGTSRLDAAWFELKVDGVRYQLRRNPVFKGGWVEGPSQCLTDLNAAEDGFEFLFEGDEEYLDYAGAVARCGSKIIDAWIKSHEQFCERRRARAEELAAQCEPNEDMDGDHASALASAGWGTDEDYGCYGDCGLGGEY